jgi:transposase
MLVTMVCQLLRDEPTMFKTDAIRAIAKLAHVSDRTIRTALAQWETDGKIQPVVVEKRGAGSSNYVNSRVVFGAEHLTAIDEWIDTQAAIAGGAVSIGEIEKFVKQRFNITCCANTIGDVLRKLGYYFQKTKGAGMRRRELSRQLERKFLVEYSAALKKEKDGNGIIFYMDESYCHQGHVGLFMWAKSEEQRRPCSKGKRVIMVHAISKHGPVVTLDADGYPIVEGSLDGNGWGAVTAEMIYKAKSSHGDYHDNMDGDMFMKWFEERFHPTVTKLAELEPEKYGNGKEKFLVLDNAPYHHAHDEEWVNVNAMNKTELLQVMIDIKLDKFKVGKTNRVFVVADLKTRMDNNNGTFAWASNKRNTGGPSKEEMQAATYAACLEKAPERLQSRVEKWAEENGWTLIFTAPYRPKHQPIELFWASAKNHAGKMYRPGRTMPQLREQLRRGWYGGTDEAGRSVNPSRCGELIRHAQDEMTVSIGYDNKLDGTIHDLICSASERRKLSKLRARGFAIDPDDEDGDGFEVGDFGDIVDSSDDENDDGMVDDDVSGSDD